MLNMAVLLLLLLLLLMMMMMIGVKLHHRASRPWEEDLRKVRTANIL